MNHHAPRRAAALSLSLLLAGAGLAPCFAAAPNRALRPTRLQAIRAQAAPRRPVAAAAARGLSSALPARPAHQPAAAKAPSGIFGILRGAQGRFSTARQPGGAAAQNVLTGLFDGGSRALSAEENSSEGCPGIGPKADPSQPQPEPEPVVEPQPPLDLPIERFLQHAIGEFFGELAPGQVPGVLFANRRERLGVEAAPTEGQMLSNVKESKRTNAEREQITIKLFVAAGAKYDPARAVVKVPDPTRTDEVQLQEVLDWRGRITGKHNVFVFKKGRTDRILVNSGHVDKVSAGDGVIDNWVGTTLAVHLYQTEKDEPTEATRLYITFAREEEGLVGSRFFLESLPADQRARYEADLNYDSIAMKGGGTEIWENNSDEVLVDAADKAVAAANKSRGPQDRLSLVRKTFSGGDSDSSSFRAQGIAATTIASGLDGGIWDVIHSANDNIRAFDLALYKNTYHVALALLRWLDKNPVKAGGSA